MQIIKKYKMEILYILVLFLVIFNQKTTPLFLILKALCILSLWIVPYFLNLYFKVINTLVLGFSIQFISVSLFDSFTYRAGGLAITIAIMLYFALISNIFMVIKQMYALEGNSSRRHYGLKLLYVVLAFILLISTIVLSYSHIYSNIWNNNPAAFSIATNGSFQPLYYSSTTYFTVGYGDITPVNSLARAVSMSQMFLGYMITCLILPTVLVSFQKLFEKNKTFK